MHDQRTSAARPRLRVQAGTGIPKSDGRTAFHRIVQYEVDGKLQDLPPDDGRVYFVRIHDLPAYDRMRQAGALEIGHRLPVAAPIVDNRSAPGA